MLGLRFSPFGKKAGNFPNTSASEIIENNDDMDTLGLGRPAALSSDLLKAKASSVTVKEGHSSDSDESSQGVTSFSKFRIYEIAYSIITQLIDEIDDLDRRLFEDITIDSYLNYIAEERLLHLPRRGSSWDRVLKSAEFFGCQIDEFGKIIEAFAPQSHKASRAVLGSCKALLQLGPRQAHALETSFSILYELAILIAETVRTHDLKIASDSIKEDLGELYVEFIRLLSKILKHYRTRINSMTTSSVKIDFFEAFGKTIDKIYQKKEDLANHRWAIGLSTGKYGLSIENVRHCLRPVDKSGRHVLLDRFATNHRRAEGTCEWAQDDLLDFLRSSDQIFTITGAPGTGKSTIANWMKTRFQRPINRRSYETISHTFPFDATAEATSLACVKNLLSQLLERNVGDVKLFEKLVDAFEGFSKNKDSRALESKLWTALETGLKTVTKSRSSIIVIIDALDEISGGDDKAREFHSKLHKAMDHTANTRAITFSQPISNLTSPGVKHIVITPDQTHDDLEAYIEEALAHERQYKSQSHELRAKFVENLIHKASGSFLWASVVLNALRKEDDSQERFQKIANSATKGLKDLLASFIGQVDFDKSLNRSIFALMLAAERPLSVIELTHLLQVNISKKTLGSEPSAVDLRKHLKTACDQFIVERQGVVQFRHSEIRRFLLELSVKGAPLMTLKEANKELTTRMLLYAKTIYCDHSHEPTFDFPSAEVVEEHFHSHQLMEYVVRNWLVHFRRSSMYSEKGDLSLSVEFHAIFPDSVFFALLERSCWRHALTTTELVSNHDLALRIRIGCFGKSHVSVLQNMIVIGGYRYELMEIEASVKLIYEASCIGQKLLARFHTFLVGCTNLILNYTKTITITTRTQIVIYREETILFMIKICKARHGEKSDAVIKWYEVLAKLYIDIKEEHKATVIYRELHIILVARFGKAHPRCIEIAETLRLAINLKMGSEGMDLIQYRDSIFEMIEDLELVDELSISITIKLALEYEARGEWFLAEQLYIDFWMRISEICRIRGTIEIHIAKLTITVAYVKFLQRIKRIEEASNILLCLWAEYEHHKFESELLILKFKEVGILFKSFGLLKCAISVLSKVWGWFKGKGKHDHEEALSTTIIITEVVEEIIETKTTTVTTVETTETVEVVKEIFETTITRCKHKKVDRSFFKACLALISLYISQKKWSEVEVVIIRSLEISWKQVLTVDTEITITKEFAGELIILATKLAICYREQFEFEKAEKIYLRVYHACIRSLHVESVEVVEAYTTLIAFYEAHHRHERAIEIYIEVLGHYRKHLGHSHKLTIRLMYQIGGLCVKYGRKDAYEWYIEIVRVLGAHGGHCHHDSFEAYVILTKHYYEVKKWTELRTVCEILWKTFVHHHHEFKFTAELIQVLYERYSYVLKVHAKVEFSVLYKLTVEYRETVTKFAGVTAEIVTIAMLALAEICETHEEHWHESITIYEEVIKRTVTRETKTTITTTTEVVKKRLSKVYVQIITSGKSCTTTTVERAIALCLEIYLKFKIELGCWHETTLTKLRELVLLYVKVQKLTEVISILQKAVIEIITTVTTSISLYHAALSLASIYVACGQVEVGGKLLHQLRHLLVLKDMSTEKITITLGCEVTKVSYVFLAAFEIGLYKQKSISFSEIMADILTETVLIEQYTHLLKVETKIEVLLQTGARLRCYWHSKSRSSAVTTLDEKLFAAFLKHYGVHFKVDQKITFKFYAALLAEFGLVVTKRFDFAHLAVLVSTKHVTALLEKKDFVEAHAVAQCAFQFLLGQKLYSSPHGLAHGYRLAALLAGIGAPHPSDAGQRNSLVSLSKEILTYVLATARGAGISFVSLNFADLNGLVGLLGAQKNYSELEQLLSSLWASREVQKNWTDKGARPTVLSIGFSLVHARFAAGKVGPAIELAENLAYNLRRSCGPLDAEARKAGRLLSSLYASSGRFKDAMGEHEEVLREIDENGDDLSEETRKVAVEEVKLLHAAFARNKGWDKSEATYKSVVRRMERFGVKEDVTKWKTSVSDDSFGKLKLNEKWQLVGRNPDEVGSVVKRDRRKIVSQLWLFSKSMLSV